MIEDSFEDAETEEPPTEQSHETVPPPLNEQADGPTLQKVGFVYSTIAHLLTSERNGRSVSEK